MTQEIILRNSRTNSNKMAGVAMTVAIVLSTPIVTQAQILDPLFGLFHTGVTNPSPIISQIDGAAELHYSLISGPGVFPLTPTVAAEIGGFPIPPWLLDTPVTGNVPCDATISRWITPLADAASSLPVGQYTYRTTFDLTGFDPNTVVINGCWSTDNEGVDILLNGTSISPPISPGFTGWTLFGMNTGFASGSNNLDFVVDNFGGPSGLRVTWTVLTGQLLPVPEPSSLALLGIAMISLSVASRRKS